jgi:hypothetical protein
MLLAHYVIEGTGAHPYCEGTALGGHPVGIGWAPEGMRRGGQVFRLVVVVSTGTKEIFHMDRLLIGI